MAAIATIPTTTPAAMPALLAPLPDEVDVGAAEVMTMVCPACVTVCGAIVVVGVDPPLLDAAVVWVEVDEEAESSGTLSTSLVSPDV